jgi:hypothetical protein
MSRTGVRRSQECENFFFAVQAPGLTPRTRLSEDKQSAMAQALINAGMGILLQPVPSVCQAAPLPDLPEIMA